MTRSRSRFQRFQRFNFVECYAFQRETLLSGAAVAAHVEGSADAGREVVVGGAQLVEVDDVAGGVGAGLADVVEASVVLGKRTMP